MSLPEGKAIYLIAFSLLLSYMRKLTDRRPPVQLIFIFVKYHSTYFHIFFFALYLCCDYNLYVLHLIFIVMEKYYLCSVQSKVNPNQSETILVPVDEVSAFVSSHLRPDCILIVSHCSTFKAISDEK